jgi:ribonucleoside-triphosphate reductase
MELSTSILSEITVYMKYAKYIPELNRRETWEELVTRNMDMHIKKYPQLEAEIRENYKFVLDKKVLPSMRSMQFAGKPIELSPNRIYNCFSRDTEFISSEGLVSFEDFENGDSIVVQTHKGNWKKATVRNYGMQDLNAVTFRRGKSKIQVKVTPNHRWLLKDGEETVNLKVEDKILPPPGTKNFDYDIANQIDRYGWVVESVIPVGREQVWCLEVEDDRSFILKGGIVTGNCAFAPIDDYRVFGEIIFLLLGGTGVGYSVQKHHVEQLPEIRKPNKERTRRYLIADSIEGWADAVKALVKSYYHGGSRINFDFSDIRPKGARLITSGGKAPGPQPLKECLVKIEGILDTKLDGDKLTPLEAHDIVCHIADAVLAGGIRRAALISLFSADDDEMIACKSGAWWEENPQRGRANNSAVLLRHRVEKEFFMELWKRVELSGAGEPGIIFSNDKDWGCNPCAEIALRPYQFCNLTEVNVSNVDSQEDFEARVRAGAFIGTLQAGYTDFHYLRPVWQRTTEKDALIGVSMTGIGSGAVLKMDMKAGARVVKEENERVAGILGINKAARTTTVKPAGTTSLTLGTSSGIHAWHNDYYLRRIRVGKNEAIYTYLAINHPELVEDEFFRPHDTAVISVPQKAPEGAIMRTESPFQLLERVKRVYLDWIKPGHRNGNNCHNVSATVSIRPHEWASVGEWLWENRDNYTGLSVLPYDGGSYTQAPFTDITKEEYERLEQTLHGVDLSRVVELSDNTDLAGELACFGASCETK